MDYLSQVASSIVFCVINMNLDESLKQLEKASHQALQYVMDRQNIEKIGKITAISVATYVVVNVSINIS